MKFNVGSLIFYKEGPYFWTGIIIENDYEYITYIIFRASNSYWLGKYSNSKKLFENWSIISKNKRFIFVG